MPQQGHAQSSTAVLYDDADANHGDGDSSEPHTNTLASETQKPSYWIEWFKSLFAREEDSSLKEALQEVLDEHSEDVQTFAPEERKILNNLIGFGDVEVSDIMTPQVDLVAIELSATLESLRDLVLEERHTRIPVYEDGIDNIKGFVHAKDLLEYIGHDAREFAVANNLREVMFVPEAMKVSDLLLKMRISGMHLAIVVDEYGGTSGLVTLEDLFEEIVGDIQDEHDDPLENRPLQWSRKSTLVMEAKTRVDELEESLGIRFSEENEEALEDDYDTIGGFLFVKLGYIPKRGESVNLPNRLRLEVLEADDRRIKTVRLTRMKSK